MISSLGADVPIRGQAAVRQGERASPGWWDRAPAGVTDPGRVLAAIGRAVGADLAGTGPPMEALAETFGDDAWLLILDNLEQVVGVARDLGELLARCPQLAIGATSRTVLGLRGEREYPVPPLLLPADPLRCRVSRSRCGPGRCTAAGAA